MPQSVVRSAGLAIVLGLGTFMLLMGAAMGLVVLNARLAACGWLRWLGGSTLPALAAHFWQNFALAVVLWNRGPFDLGALSPATLAIVAATGLVALAATVAIGRKTPAYAGPQYGYARRPAPR